MQVLTPYQVARRMMRNGRDPGLIVAYLVEEARRAGVDPSELAPLSFSELFARQFAPLRDAVVQFGRALGLTGPRPERRADFALAGPPRSGPP